MKRAVMMIPVVIVYDEKTDPRDIRHEINSCYARFSSSDGWSVTLKPTVKLRDVKAVMKEKSK